MQCISFGDKAGGGGAILAPPPPKNPHYKYWSCKFCFYTGLDMYINGGHNPKVEASGFSTCPLRIFSKFMNFVENRQKLSKIPISLLGKRSSWRLSDNHEKTGYIERSTFFLLDHIGQTKSHRLASGLPDVWLWRNDSFPTQDDDCALPPTLGSIGVKERVTC